MTKTTIAPMKPTPEWAKWVFRIALYLNAAFAIYLASTTLIPTDMKLELNLVLNAFVVPGIHLLSKMFGLKETDHYNSGR